MRKLSIPPLQIECKKTTTEISVADLWKVLQTGLEHKEKENLHPPG